jgi:integrase
MFARCLPEVESMARKSLTDKGISALRPRHARYSYADPQLAGHYIRVTPNNVKSYICAARNPDGKQVWTTIGNCEVMPIQEARGRAREYLQRVRDGLPAIAPKGENFGAVAANWIKRHVEPNGLRSGKEIRRLLDRHILPVWRDRGFIGIKRSDVAALLDEVEDDHGARQADYCLNVVRSIMNWFAARHDDYGPPIVRGMRRQSPHAQSRTRVLDDSELTAIWKQAEAKMPSQSGKEEWNDTFGAFIRVALLTAQRREKIRSMKFDDISDDGEWTIPTAPREKDSIGSVVLPKAALAIINAQPRLASNPYVFAGRGQGPFNGFSKAKARFDAKLKGVKPWTIHDARRTARSLMSRAGVSSDHAERVMGHAIGGVEGIYDRHSYADEKADALARLATLIEGIVNPRPANVTELRKQAKRATKPPA